MSGILTSDKMLESMSVLDMTKTFGQQAVFSCSYSDEDVLIYHLLSISRPVSVHVVTLDTGRLPPETYEVMEAMRERTPEWLAVDVLVPDSHAVAELETNKGLFSFRESVENRKECCYIRKVEPLKRALTGKKAWITGLRSGQAATRGEVPLVEWDNGHSLIKVNPLAKWTREEVIEAVEGCGLPRNRLYEQGYTSIGCAPCTRAVGPNEDERAGRWWWEEPETKECGLHSG